MSPSTVNCEPFATVEPETSPERLIEELAQLRLELEILQREKLDLEIMVENITEHADAIEVELRARNRDVQELNERLALANKELEQLASVDGLTGIANRRRFDITLEREWKRLTRDQKPFSLILGDIDYFKRYNDTYGHQAGDDCLQKVCQACHDCAKRATDLAARYGGEEIALILPDTDSIGAMYIAQEIRQRIRKLNIKHEASPIGRIISMSLGVATVTPHSRIQPTLLVNQADMALYQAKQNGRNRIVLFHKSL
jgi:diguanylate cyclase (GGDEF)-like protein